MPTVLVQIEQLRITDKHYLDAVLALVRGGALPAAQVRIAARHFQYRADPKLLPPGMVAEDANVVTAKGLRPGVILVTMENHPVTFGPYLSQMDVDYDPHAPTPVGDLVRTVRRAATLLCVAEVLERSGLPNPVLDVAAGTGTWQLSIQTTEDTATLTGGEWSKLRTIASSLGVNLHEEE